MPGPPPFLDDSYPAYDSDGHPGWPYPIIRCIEWVGDRAADGYFWMWLL